MKARFLHVHHRQNVLTCVLDGALKGPYLCTSPVVMLVDVFVDEGQVKCSVHVVGCGVVVQEEQGH